MLLVSLFICSLSFAICILFGCKRGIQQIQQWTDAMFMILLLSECSIRMNPFVKGWLPSEHSFSRVENNYYLLALWEWLVKAFSVVFSFFISTCRNIPEGTWTFLGMIIDGLSFTCATYYCRMGSLSTMVSQGSSSNIFQLDSFPYKIMKDLQDLLGGGCKKNNMFTPTRGDDPIWRAYFSDGLKPPTSLWHLF